MKRTLAFVLALMLCISMLTGISFASEVPFPDVSKNDWFYNDVAFAYESGLFNGRNGKFYPNDNMTYAEAIKLAACMYQRYTEGAVTLTNGSPKWYQSYVDYAKSKGIIAKDYAWDQAATRAGYMEIFARALPDYALKEINSVTDNSIPDVPMSHPQSWAIYKLYRAGILQGDTKHNCNPASNIERCQVAAIITRMMNVSERISFSLGEQPKPVEPEVKPLTILVHPQNVAGTVGNAVEFTTSVTGGKTPYKYTWQYKNNSIDWTDDGSSLTNTITKMFNASQLAAGIQYRCVITDALGTVVTTNAAMVTAATSKPIPTPALTIIEQPQNASAKLGDSATFTVKAAGGTAPYKYQWQSISIYDSAYSNITDNWAQGTNSDTLTILSIAEDETEDKWQYRCVVTDAEGKTVTSNSANVVVTGSLIPVLPEKPIIGTLAELEITSQPQDQTADVGDSVTFTVSVKGGLQPYKYKWKGTNNQVGSFVSIDNISSITGQDTASLTVSNISVNEKLDGWKYQCTITDGQGNSVTTNAVKVNLKDAKPFVITSQPTSKVAKVGDDVTFSVSVSGGREPYKYQWEMIFGGFGSYTPLGSMDSTFGEKGPNFYLYNVTEDEENENRMYRCVITDAEGKQIISDSVKVNLLDDMSNALKCESYSPNVSAYKVNSGSVVTLSAKFTGGKTPYYSMTWEYYDGTGWKTYNMSHEDKSVTSDTATLSFKALTAYSGYKYRCECVAANGSMAYSPAIIVYVTP